MNSGKHNNCQACSTNQQCIFKVLTPTQKQLLQSKRIEITRKKDASLFTEGDHAATFYIIREGLLKHVRKLNRDENFFIEFIKEGDIVGLASFQSEGVFVSSAIALTQVECCAIPANLIQNFLKENNKLNEYFFDRYHRYLLSAGNKIFELVKCSALNRTAKTLLVLNQYLPASKQGFSINREELAELNGMTRETSSRQLSVLKQRQVIAITNNRIKITNPEKLKVLTIC